MTVISRFCERFIEAGWLVAFIVAATFLNPFSDQVFEPDKAALLRSLTVLMLAAWVIQRLDDAASSVPRTLSLSQVKDVAAEVIQQLRETPIAALALAVFLIYVVSTLASVSPRVSWWGSYQRAQGAYTFLTYLVLFFLVLSTLRREDQLQRLITTLLLASFPVALYAILQHYGMSLVQFSEAGVETRVISTLGNAIFLGAYLAMVIPLTLWRLLESVQGWSDFGVRSTVASLLYAGLLTLQLAGVVFAQSRGPIAGLGVELVVFVLLVGALRGRRRWALAGVLLAVMAVAVLVVVNIPGLAPDALRNLPAVARFTGVLDSNELRARALAWRTVLDVVSASPLRTLVGYGPETMKSVFTTFMPAKLWVLQGGGEYGTFDRAHNAVFDALYARGLVGVASHLLLYGLVFYQSLRWLGLAQSQREAGSLVGLLAGGALVGLIVPGVWRGDLAMAGIGVPAGMVVGMILYLIGRTVVAPAPEQAADEVRLLLLAALLAAIVGHFVEMQTGIGIVVTRSYFWLYTALIILLGTGRLADPEVTHSSPTPQSAGQGRSRRGRRSRSRDQTARDLLGEFQYSVVALGLLVAALLGLLSYAFVHGFGVAGARVPAQVLIWCTWLFAGLIILVERDRFAAEVPSLSGDAMAYAVPSLAWLLPFVAYHRANAQTLDRLISSYVVLLLWLLLTVIGIAVVLGWGWSSRSKLAPGRLSVYVLILALALVWSWRVDVNRIRADIHHKVGKTAMGAGLVDQAIVHLERAAELQPERDQYYIYLGGIYVEKARMAAEVETQDVWMEQARRALEQGWGLAPRDSDHPRQLGLAYRVWGEWVEEPATHQKRLEQSLDYYQAAVELNPENPDLRLDLADAYFALGMNDEALAQYRHAVDIGSPRHLGRAYAGLGDIYLIRGQLEEAGEAYQQAMTAGRDKQEVMQARIDAVNRRPESVEVRESLALVYAAAGRPDDALAELSAALRMTSSDAERREVEKLIEMVGR